VQSLDSALVSTSTHAYAHVPTSPRMVGLASEICAPDWAARIVEAVEREFAGKIGI
jgi:hypothetical protein